MTSWNPEANDLFLKVLERPTPEERQECLDQVCAAKPELRAQVEALLQASQRAGSFLERPAIVLAYGQEPADGPPSLYEGPGTRIGPYQLLQPLGEGGMGIVYLAEQEVPVRRQVALKIIKPGLDSREVIARFEAEQQALALMDHPNIARVLDAGTIPGVRSQESGVSKQGPLTPDPWLLTPGSGRPYFVMELVTGVPLTRYGDEARLSVRQRLELFIPVCRAVQHAHQKGIIHRDLKPANILVALYDGRPVPKIIDFGVAKTTGLKPTNRTVFTAFGTVVGTLEYMAPEQAELHRPDVDTRGDIYSLGAILYELLTGTTPLGRQRLQEVPLGEMLRLIREEEPPRPSTRLSQSPTLPSVAAARQAESRRLCQLVQGDLDWVVMKALAKERDRRYDTADALAADLERYLRDEPVLAGPPGAGYRVRKLVRRHKGKVAAAAGMLALLLAGVVASAWQAVRATRAERAATAALAAETAAKAQTRQALDTLTDDVVQTLLAKQPVLGEAEKAFLRKVLAYYEAFARQMGETPEARALRAQGYARVALIHRRLGERGEAEVAYRQALAILDPLAAELPDVAAYRSDLARRHHDLGAVLEDLGQLAEAETAYRRALALQEQLAADFPDVAAHRREAAASQGSLGNLLRQLGKPAEAEAAYGKALALQGQLAADFPDVPVHRQDLALTHNLLANLLRERGKLPEAEAAYRRALALHAQLAADFPAVPQYRRYVAAAYNNLGLALRRQAKYAEAEAAHRQGLATQVKLAADFPAVPEHRQLLAGSYNNLGILLRHLGKYAQAEAAHRQAVAINAPLAADFPAVPEYRRDLAVSRSSLGKALLELGKLAEAETAHRQALEQWEKLAADFPATPRYRAEHAGNLVNFGGLLLKQQRPADALASYDRALALLQPLHAQEPRDAYVRESLRYAHWGRAQALDDLKRHDEALAAWDQALELATPAERPKVQLGRAGSRLRAGEAAEAEVEALTQDPATRGSILCEAASTYARAAAALPDDARRRERYAGRALALLRRAQAAGFLKDRRRVEHLKQAADFEALRPREDFQKLLAELEAALAEA